MCRHQRGLSSTCLSTRFCLLSPFLAAFPWASAPLHATLLAFLLATSLLFPRDADCFPWRKHLLLLCACFLLLCACCSICCKPRGRQTFWLLSPRLATDGKCMLRRFCLLHVCFFHAMLIASPGANIVCCSAPVFCSSAPVVPSIASRGESKHSGCFHLGLQQMESAC